MGGGLKGTGQVGMKKRVRTITVNGQKFAWWCRINEHETVVKLSPLEDKTSIISVFFSGENIRDGLSQFIDGIVISWVETGNPLLDQTSQHNESVLMAADGEAFCIKIMEPRMAALLVTYLTGQNCLCAEACKERGLAVHVPPGGCFATRRSIRLNGYELLSQMGYQVLEVQKGYCW